MKKSVYGGLGAPLLTWTVTTAAATARLGVDRRPINATAASKFGAHNGWHASGQQVFDADVDNPAGFVRNKNSQAGTSWDKYDVKAGEAGADGSGSIGARSSTVATALEVGKDARNAPTATMLDQYSVVRSPRARFSRSARSVQPQSGR